jgi:hypothetical protein
MDVETFFLAIFAFGVLLTLASAVLGSFTTLNHGFGHFHGHGTGHAQLGHGHASGHAGAHADHGARLTSLPLLSGSSVLGFVTWFGAGGYVLLRLSDWALPVVLLGAFIGGAAGALIVARFLGLILAGEREMDPADYVLEGTVGQITIGIPEGGTGEVVFSKVGARRSEAARALGGVAIPRGTEVVITRYVDGFATVQPWGEFLATREPVKEKREA